MIKRRESWLTDERKREKISFTSLCDYKLVGCSHMGVIYEQEKR